MGRFEFDWSYTRRHTLRPLLCAAISAVVLVVSSWLYAQNTRDLSEYNTQYGTVRADFDELLAQQRVVERYHRRYDRFREIGFVGRESRLDWLETVRTTAESLALSHVNYSIEPQLEVVAPVKSRRNNNDTQISVSKAELELGLNHELDLLRFFDALQKKAPGLIKVDECALSWQSNARDELVAGNNLAAFCTVQIYSVITSDIDEEDA